MSEEIKKKKRCCMGGCHKKCKALGLLLLGGWAIKKYMKNKKEKQGE